MENSYTSTKVRMHFLILLVMSLLILFLNRSFLLSDSLYINSLSEKFSYEEISELINRGNRLELLTIPIVLLICIIKLALCSLCLTLGVFFIADKFEFKKVFAVTVVAEFIFLVPSAIKLLWFLFFQTSYTLQDLQYFYPLCILNIFEASTLEPWLIYPLQVLNIFEVIYWIILAYLLTKELPELDINRSMTVVMASYGTGLVIWVAFVMFLTLTYT